MFLFDLYGTLFDVETEEESDRFWQEVARILHTGDADGVKTFYLTACARAAEKLPEGGEIDLLPVFALLCKRYRPELSAISLASSFRAASTLKLTLFDYALPLLRGLKMRHAELYLLSNAQSCFTREEIARLGIGEYFTGIMLSSEVGWKKPALPFFQTAIKRFSLSPENCLYVGNDLRDDVGGARAAGMRSVYIQTKQSGVYDDPPAVDLRATPDTLCEMLFRFAEGEEIR